MVLHVVPFGVYIGLWMPPKVRFDPLTHSRSPITLVDTSLIHARENKVNTEKTHEISLPKMSSQKSVDHYAVLGVPADSTFVVIRKAFFKLSLACHPDRRNKSEFEAAHKEFVRISAAYNVLKDKQSRDKYDSTRGHAMQRPMTSQRGHEGDPWRYRENDEDEDEFESQASRFPGSPRFYADQSKRDARKCHQARRADREYSKHSATNSNSDDSKNTGENQPPQPYESPRHKDDKQVPPEEEVWLRYRIAKNNLQGLSFSLQDALYSVLEIVRSLRKFDAVKSQAAKARVQLRFIEATFSSIQFEMDSVHSPSWLTQATVTRVKKMTILEEHIRRLLGMLKTRPPAAGPGSFEEEALSTSKLVLKTMNRCVHICK